MKFKEGDKVTVLCVPERAKRYGVVPGMTGVIVPTGDTEEEKHAAALGLVKVCINNGCQFGPDFWWRAVDLIPSPPTIKLTIVDEGHHVLGKPSAQGKRAFSFGYDPYNSVHAHIIYLRIRMAGIYATT